MAARKASGRQFLTAMETSILHNVIALDEDIGDQWPIRETIKARGNLVPILEQFPEGVNAFDEYGYLPLYWAMREKNTAAIRTLISHGADPDMYNAYHTTPLMIAAHYGLSDAAQILIESGCDIGIGTLDRANALHYALSSYHKGTTEIVGLLLGKGAFLCDEPYGGAFNSLVNRSSDVYDVSGKFQLLVDAGAEIDSSVLGRALGSDTLLRLLVDAGCEANREPNINNILFDAAYYGNAHGIDAVNETKFTSDVRVRDERGKTPLDIFRWRAQAPPLWLPGEYNYPSNNDIEAFRTLLGDVRDRYLTAEVQALEIVVMHLKAQEFTRAQEALQPIIKEKMHWNIPAEYRTFRSIGVQIREEMTEAAIESLEEFIGVSNERIGTDPFEGDYCYSSSLKDQGLIVEDVS
ncbi:hypothetical protein M426DRAFT_251712 [Hypoxylon sp. CI-4A]|nr:hypothetical protein M426DRAFT_251712 [Hypoxylon sp. CI-4A]